MTTHAPPDAPQEESMHRHRLGVRGYAMLLCSFIWCLIGYGITRGTGVHIPGTFHDQIPTWIRLCVWFVPAALALALAWSTRLDWVALALLIIGPVVRCCSYTIAWLLTYVGRSGYHDGWYAASFYLALIGIVGLAAGSHRQPYMREQHEYSGERGDS